MSKTAKVLWTSGWDSTFRVIDLYKKGTTIQPIYVFDDNRASSKKEVETIEILTSEIIERFKNSKGRILPLKLIERNQIAKDIFLKLIYKVLKSRKHLGKQYYWLACLAKDINPLELSLNKIDLLRFFRKDQLIEFDGKTLGKNWKINPKKVDFFVYKIFRNMNFPIIEVSKVEMKKIAEENNFIDIMNQTWFCHDSDTKPCEKCNPCKQHIKDNMAYRLDKT